MTELQKCLDSGPAWVNSTVAVLAVAGDSQNTPEAQGCMRFTLDDGSAFICPNVRSALKTAVAAANGGLACGLIIAELTEQALTRVMAIAAMAAPGELVLTLAAQDLARDCDLELQFTDIGHRSVEGRTERLFASVIREPSRVSFSHFGDSGEGFIGRSEELANLKTATDQSRLVTVCGPAGIGKSALLTRFVRERQAEFPGSIYFVDFQATTHTSLVPAVIARDLDVTSASGRNAVEPIIDALRTSDAIVVFDNSQRVSTALRPIVTAILKECPQIGIIVGSQRALRIAGERRLPLEGLPCPTMYEHIDSIRSSDAVGLFEETARLFDSRFQVAEHNAQDVAQLCGRLDGSPLAIKLAAAKVKALSPRQILMRMDDRFLLLRSDEGQMSLLHAVSWAHELLSHKSQVLLRRLAVFQGAFSVDWAEEVCTDTQLSSNELLTSFEELIDSSFVMLSSLDLPQKMFYLNQTTRAYALQRLKQSGDAAQVEILHGRWLNALSHRAAEQIDGPDQRLWLKIMDAAFDDIREAVKRANLPRVDAELQIQTLLTCFTYLWERALYRDGLALCEQLIDARSARSAPSYPRLLVMAGSLAASLGDNKQSRRFAVLAMRSARSFGDALQTATSLSALAYARLLVDRSDLARSYFERSAAILAEIGDSERELSVRTNLMAMDCDAGRLSQAQGGLQRALKLADESANPALRAHLHQNAAHVMLMAGDHYKALEHAASAASVYCETGAPTLARSYRNICYALMGIGRHFDAAIFWHAAQKASRRQSSEETSDQEWRFNVLEFEIRKHVGEEPFERAGELADVDPKDLLARVS